VSARWRRGPDTMPPSAPQPACGRPRASFRPGCPFLFRGRGVAGQGANIPGMYLDRPPDGVDGDRRERAGHDEPDDVSVPAGCFRGDGGQRLGGLSPLDSPDLWPRRHRQRVAACPHDSCLLLSRCVTAAEGVHTAGLDQSARRPARQHPTAERARSEHGQKTGTNRARKEDPRPIKPQVRMGAPPGT